MEVVDELGETVELEVLILVDTSASMKSKITNGKRSPDRFVSKFKCSCGRESFFRVYISREKE